MTADNQEIITKLLKQLMGTEAMSSDDEKEGGGDASDGEAVPSSNPSVVVAAPASGSAPLPSSSSSSSSLASRPKKFPSGGSRSHERVDIEGNPVKDRSSAISRPGGTVSDVSTGISSEAGEDHADDGVLPTGVSEAVYHYLTSSLAFSHSWAKKVWRSSFSFPSPLSLSTPLPSHLPPYASQFNSPPLPSPSLIALQLSK